MRNTIVVHEITFKEKLFDIDLNFNFNIVTKVLCIQFDEKKIRHFEKISCVKIIK